MGIALSIISILVSISLSFILGPLSGLSIIIDILLIVLIAVGWSSLR